MSKFRAADGFIHFVFAKQDNYYLDSLVCFNREKYIYYLLKQDKEYQKVFFVSEKENTIRTYDDESKKYWRQYDVDGFFGKKSLADKIKELIGDGRKDIALVCSIEDFYRLGEHAKLKEKFVEISQDKLLRKMILVLVVEPKDKRNMEFLSKGIYQSSYLFPELRQLKTEEELQQIFGSRVVCMNPLERTQILRRLLHVILTKKELNEGLLDRVDDYADILYTWFSSSSFRLKIIKKYGRLASSNDLKEKLEKTLIWSLMDDIRKEIRKNEASQSLLTILKRTEVFDNRSKNNHSLKEQLQSLMTQERFALRIKKLLEHGIVENEDVKKVQLYFERALNRREIPYLEQSINCLDYLTFKEKEEVIFDCYLKIFELFDATFELKGDLKEVEEKLKELDFELVSAYEQAERFDSEEKKAKCLVISDSIEHWKAVKLTKSQSLEEYEKKIEELEVSIQLSDNPQVDVKSFDWIIN